jgi:hypothetical protein
MQRELLTHIGKPLSKFQYEFLDMIDQGNFQVAFLGPLP